MSAAWRRAARLSWLSGRTGRKRCAARSLLSRQSVLRAAALRPTAVGELSAKEHSAASAELKVPAAVRASPTATAKTVARWRIKNLRRETLDPIRRSGSLQTEAVALSREAAIEG